MAASVVAAVTQLAAARLLPTRWLWASLALGAVATLLPPMAASSSSLVRVLVGLAAAARPLLHLHDAYTAAAVTAHLGAAVPRWVRRREGTAPTAIGAMCVLALLSTAYLLHVAWGAADGAIGAALASGVVAAAAGVAVWAVVGLEGGTVVDGAALLLFVALHVHAAALAAPRQIAPGDLVSQLGPSWPVRTLRWAASFVPFADGLMDEHNTLSVSVAGGAALAVRAATAAVFWLEIATTPDSSQRTLVLYCSWPFIALAATEALVVCAPPASTLDWLLHPTVWHGMSAATAVVLVGVALHTREHADEPVVSVFARDAEE